MILRTHILTAFSDNYLYALEGETGECVVVDPGEAKPVEDFLRTHGLKLQAVLCTHYHQDHVGGVRELARDRSDLEVWAAPGDYERIAGANRKVSDGDKLEVLGDKLEVLGVPGHTDGQVSFYFPRLEALFTGDTLFSCGCGRMFEGTYPQFFASLQKYKRLPAETKMYFGHEYTEKNIRFAESEIGVSPELENYKKICEQKLATGEFTTPAKLGLEFEINPFLIAKSVAEFQKYREARNGF